LAALEHDLDHEIPELYSEISGNEEYGGGLFAAAPFSHEFSKSPVATDKNPSGRG